MPFFPDGTDFRGFAKLRTPESLDAIPDILSWACAHLQRHQAQSRCQDQLALETWQLPPLRFEPLQRIPTRDCSISPRLASPRTLGAFRFSQPHDAFTSPVPAEPYLRPDPLLGFALQSFAPHAQLYTVSGANALLSLGTTANSHKPRQQVNLKAQKRSRSRQ
jgi:hypothetical protein